MIIPLRAAAECRIWWADPRDQATNLLARVLNHIELDRAAQFRREDDRRRFITGCWLLRTVVAEELGILPREVDVDRWCAKCGKPHGKPHIRNANGRLHVSVSHSGNRVAVAVSDAGPVGVDVEQVPSGPVDELVRCALSPDERQALWELPVSERQAGFIRLWVRKEAVLKATGHGLRIPPDQVRVSGPEERPALLSWPLDIPPSRMRLTGLHPGAGYVGAVAVMTADVRLKVSEIPAADLGTACAHAAASAVAA